jgi:hypothetical protein
LNAARKQIGDSLRTPLVWGVGKFGCRLISEEFREEMRCRTGSRRAEREFARSERPPASLDGTFTQASPSSTSSPATEQAQVSRARNFSGISSATETFTSTVSPIFTGARKFSVCEI